MPVWQSHKKKSFSWILIPTSHKWSRNWMEFKVRRSNIWRCHIRPALKRNCINCGLPKLRLVIYLWAAAFAVCLPPPLHNSDSMFVSLRPSTSHGSPVFPDPPRSTRALRHGGGLLQRSQVSTGGWNVTNGRDADTELISFSSQPLPCVPS